MVQRVRIDDVMWSTSDKTMVGKEVQKFQKYVRWCQNTNITVVPAILCNDIEKFPECIVWLKDEIEKGKLVSCDLHGWEHVDYGSMSLFEIREHLEKALTWFETVKLPLPIRWVTPWGANSPAMQQAATEFDIIIEDTTHPVIDQAVADSQLRITRDPDILKDKVLMCHWWDRGLRLYRICQVLYYNSVAEAIAHSNLSAKDKAICWKGWADE